MLVQGDAAPDAPVAAAATHSDGVDRTWLPVDWLAIAILTLASVLFVSTFTQAYPTYSPIDELQHVDYAIKAGRFEIVPEGDRLSETAMRSFACAGVDSPGFPVPACDTPVFDPYYFPEHGYNTAALQLPVYYTLTGVIGRVLDATTPMGVLTSMRMTGALWLALALALTWLIGAELGVARLRRALALALFVPSVQVLFTSSTVNADNALMVGGALVVLAALRAERGASWRWLVGASLGALAMEPTSSLAIGVVCVFMLVRAVHRTERDERRRLAWLSLGVGAAATTAVLFFDLVRDALIGGRVPPALPRYADLFTPNLDGDEVVANVFSLVTPISKPYLPPFVHNDLTSNLNSSTAVALVALLVGALVVHRTRKPTGALSAALIAVMITSGPLLVLYLYVHSSVYFEIPSRYGLAMMPAAMAVAATALGTRPVRWAVGALAALHAGQLVALLVAHA